MKLYVCGKAGAGKDEVANYLVNKYNFINLKFAKGIYDIAYEHFDMKDKDRRLLQIIGNVTRIVDPNFWIKQALNKVQPNKDYILSDCRFINEHKALTDNNFIGLNITVDDNIRFDRLELRDGKCQKETLNDISETEMDKFRFSLPWQIDNNGSKEELYKKLDNIIQEIKSVEIWGV